uniref:Anaphase-promoting complex subunit 7 n=1 Tax=Rhizochromulina marina TaxID=1034831 RepID=A0A7S2WJE0_9STRA|mmetsp:Transcript_26019/g.75881  ORF Transcript_26019/g.75881 Transcript_26019/m.75881 type:complete len:586 (+) Transcript_26019:24-1781(+)
MEDVLVMQTQVKRLNEQKLFPSAEKLGAMLLCASRAVPYDQLPLEGEGSHSESLSLYADSLFGKGEFQRALHFYKQATQRIKIGPHISGHRSPPNSSSPASSSSPSSPNYSSVQRPEEAELRFKESQCYHSLGEISKAIRCLEAVPLQLRNAAMNLSLGAMYMSTGTGSRLNAIKAYKEALRQNPTALEALSPLVNLGVGRRDLLDMMSSSANGPPPQWIESYIDGLGTLTAADNTQSIHHWSTLDNMFPNNLPSMLHLGLLHLDADRLDEAQYFFNKARVTDPSNLEMMDHYALLLHLRGDVAELNRLAHDLLCASEMRPEPWVALSLHAECQGDRDRALQYVDKAIDLGPSCVLGHLVKGEIMLKIGKPDLAIMSFFRAKENRKELRCYHGLVEAYLDASKFKEASVTAREAISNLPGNATAVALLGRVLATASTQHPDKDRARKLFAQALELDPRCVEATIGLVDLHLRNREFDQCVELLEAALQDQNQASLHAKLGDVLALQQRYSEALEHYHTAISLNPDIEEAKEGLERLEKRMRGIDPDHGEDEDGADMDPDHDLEGSMGMDGSGVRSEDHSHHGGGW